MNNFLQHCHSNHERRREKSFNSWSIIYIKKIKKEYFQLLILTLEFLTFFSIVFSFPELVRTKDRLQMYLWTIACMRNNLDPSPDLLHRMCGLQWKQTSFFLQVDEKHLVDDQNPGYGLDWLWNSHYVTARKLSPLFLLTKEYFSWL